MSFYSIRGSKQAHTFVVHIMLIRVHKCFKVIYSTTKCFRNYYYHHRRRRPTTCSLQRRRHCRRIICLNCTWNWVSHWISAETSPSIIKRTTKQFVVGTYGVREINDVQSQNVRFPTFYCILKWLLYPFSPSPSTDCFRPMRLQLLIFILFAQIFSSIVLFYFPSFIQQL